MNDEDFMFYLDKKDYDESFTLDFDLKYYNSYEGNFFGKSGHYIFTPDPQSSQSKLYS